MTGNIAAGLACGRIHVMLTADEICREYCVSRKKKPGGHGSMFT